MYQKAFPVIDPVATGKNIVRLRKERGMTVKDLQDWFGFEEPRAIYKWQHGETLPSVDNLYALSALLEVPIEEILVGSRQVNTLIRIERQDDSCRPLFMPGCLRNSGTRNTFPPFVGRPPARLKASLRPRPLGRPVYFIEKVFKTFWEAFRASLFSAFARNVERRVKSEFAVTASS